MSNNSPICKLSYTVSNPLNTIMFGTNSSNTNMFGTNPFLTPANTKTASTKETPTLKFIRPTPVAPKWFCGENPKPQNIPKTYR